MDTMRLGNGAPVQPDNNNETPTPCGGFQKVFNHPSLSTSAKGKTAKEQSIPDASKPRSSIGTLGSSEAIKDPAERDAGSKVPGPREKSRDL